MNKEIILNFAQNESLEPLAWFVVRYPAYAIKVKYLYPTSDPADFQDRALLQLIDIGIPYKTACDVLLINDPHESILRRFKSADAGPQLVGFDKTLNRIALTPIGKARIEREQLSRNGMSCCFIDGFSGVPFPIDVVDKLKDNRCHCVEVVNIPNGEYPFDPNVGQRIEELNAKLNDKKERNYLQRLQLPSNAKETAMNNLGPQWMMDLSIGLFLKDGEVRSYLFSGESPTPVSPFGYLQNLNKIKLMVNLGGKFGYTKVSTPASCVFSGVDMTSLKKNILNVLEQEYGASTFTDGDLEIDSTTGVCSIHLKSLEEVKSKRMKMLKCVAQKLMSITLPGLIGNLFIKVKANKDIENIANLRIALDKSSEDWHDIINNIQNLYPESWRKVLLDIGRHDLLFRHDMEKYIHYEYE